MFNKDNIIIFAAGGGNDVFSAIAYIESFNTNFKKIAIVSVLGFTPFHSNTEIKQDIINIELPLIKPTKQFHRYIQTLEPKEISNTEKLIEEIINENSSCIYDYICMSPKYSSVVQAINLRNLFIEWNMLEENTLLNIVDFGGDILTNGLQSSIISPELDAYTLSVVREICNHTKYIGNISVCFPSIDGELNADYLSDICLNDNIATYEFDKQIMHDKLSKIYLKLKDIRPGNTIPNMINVLESKTNDKISIQTKKHWIINKEKRSVNINTVIDLNLQSHIYIFDLYINNPFVDLFNKEPYDLTHIVRGIIDIYKLQDKSVDTIQSSDFFLQYLSQDIEGNYTNKNLIGNKVMFVDVYPFIIKHEKVSNELYCLFTSLILID